MQHDDVVKKLNFNIFTPRVGREGVCGHNIGSHVAAPVIPFNLICSMTISEKV